MIATYSLPSSPVKIVGPAAIWWPVWNFHSTLPLRTSNARRLPSPSPAKPSPDAVVEPPPRSGSGVWNFHTRLPVFTSIALIEPWSCQPCSSVPKLPFCSPRNTSPSTNLFFFCVGVSFDWIITAAVSAAALKT